MEVKKKEKKKEVALILQPSQGYTNHLARRGERKEGLEDGYMGNSKLRGKG